MCQETARDARGKAKCGESAWRVGFSSRGGGRSVCTPGELPAGHGDNEVHFRRARQQARKDCALVCGCQRWGTDFPSMFQCMQRRCKTCKNLLARTLTRGL